MSLAIGYNFKQGIWVVLIKNVICEQRLEGVDEISMWISTGRVSETL
jgi:hypothetical protein